MRVQMLMLGAVGVGVLVLPLEAAEEPSGADLPEILARTAAHHPGLRAAYDRYEAALLEVPQVGNLPDPRLTVTWFGSNPQTRTGEQEATYNLIQPIPWPGRLSREREFARTEAGAMYYAYQARQLEVLLDLALLYYDYAFLGKQTVLTRESADLVRDLKPIVEERVRGGGGLDALLRLQVELGTEENRLLALEQQRRALSARIRAAEALPNAPLLEWPTLKSPGSQTYRKDALMQGAIRHNPRLLRAEAMALSSRARLAVARLEGYPEFSLGLTYIQTGDAMMPGVEGSGDDPWGLMVTVTIPWDRKKSRAAEGEARERVSAARHDYDEALLAVEAQLETALAQWRLSFEQLQIFEDQLLPEARQALEVTESAYESGTTSILEVIDSRRSLLRLEIAYWQAVAELRKAQATLHALSTGASVPISLISNNWK